MPRVRLDTLHAHNVVSRKNDIFCIVCKKSVVKRLFRRHFFLWATKNVGFPWNSACPQRISRCARRIFVHNVWNFKMFFTVAGAHTPMCLSEFPIVLMYLIISNVVYLECGKMSPLDSYTSLPKRCFWRGERVF